MLLPQQQQRFFSLLFLFFTTLLLAACGGGGGNDKPETTDLDSSTFDAVWYGPCFNNKHDFSARQKLTINGTSLISQIKTYANAPAKTPDCTLSAASTVESDITATLAYGEQSQQTACVNNTGVNTGITLVSNQTSGTLINTQPDLGNSIQLLTGRKNDFLPNSSLLCIKSNGNLLFAGFEYTLNANPNIISATTTPPVATSPNSAVTWKVGSHNYTGGTLSGSSSASTACLSCSGDKHNYGGLVTSTSGFSSTNGAYAGSTITIGHSLTGAGTYAIVEQLNDLTSKQIKLSVIIGSGVTTGSTSYIAKSGNVDVTVDSQGRYHFNIASPIQLSFSLNVLGGVPNPPATIAFTMKNIYNFNP